MDSFHPEVQKTITTAVTSTSTNRLTATIRTEKPILELPKLVPVTDPKPSMDGTHLQSVLKKSVTTSTPAAGGQQNLIKIVPRTIPIKTIQGPNGNLLVQGLHNKLLSLKIKGSNQNTAKATAPLSLVPISLPKDTKSAMLKLSGLTSIQARKIAPKGVANPRPTSKVNPTEAIMSNTKQPNKELTMTTKPAAHLVKITSQESQSLFKTPIKDSHASLKLPHAVTSALSTSTTQVINTLVQSKAIEIKPILVSDSPKSLTPAQSATVSMTQITATNLIPKLSAMKSDANEPDVISIERKISQKPQLNKMQQEYGKGSILDSTSAPATATLSQNNPKMINLQISNGKLSDPNGPIKLISANTTVIESQDKSSPETSIVASPESNSSEKSAPVENEWIDSADMSKPLNPPPCPILTDLDRNIPGGESLHQHKPTKPKQQSLLRNKTIEILQRSPRTKCRSKSLTSVPKKVGRPRRRLSAASDGDIKRKISEKKPKNIPTVKKSLQKNSVKKLLCPEKISTSSDSLGSSSPSDDKVASAATKYPQIEVIEMDSSEDECKSPKEENVTPPPKVHENEIYNCLSWHDGVGNLKDSSLQFQFNEFGLIEILELGRINSELDLHYEKPIFEREFKSQKTLDYSNPYFCKGCNCKGAAVDFLTPEFCSRECIRRFNRRVNPGPGLKTTKKYTNRKKCVISPREIKEDPVDTKPDYISLLKPSKIFAWDTHLNTCRGEPTPIDLFLNPFPCSANLFQIGMRLEAIDPENSSLFCVCTIVEKKGYRLKLHFDGYSKYYDFWVNADSMDIFPPGWCAKTNRSLQPPRGINPLSFNWPKYLNQSKSLPAPRHLFTHLNSSSHTHGFKVGMKIEADDLRNSGKVCVATIADILDNRLLIQFDGWDDSYNYWIDINSPYIHPVNWHKKNGFSIVPPPDFENRFSWPAYLSHTGGEPATDDLFRTRDPIDFKPGMKLEVVDKRNPALIRPASVIMTDDYEIKVLFEGWPTDYAFWTEDDSPDIHPIGWCEITNHELEPPPGYDSLPSRYDCQFPACTGIGNATHPELDVHTNIMSCPYEPTNWSKEIDKSGRLSSPPRFPNEPISEISHLRFDPSLLLDIKPKEAPRNKRKAEPPLHQAVATKQSRYSQLPAPSYVQPPPSQITPTSGISLLASKIEKTETTSSVDPRINIAKHLLCDYGPRLQQIYSLWKQNSECLVVNLEENRNYHKNPMEWNANEVADYIAKLPRCQTIAQEFLKQDIDGAAFLAMRQSDLTDILKMKLGAAIKVYNQIVQLREDVVTRYMSNPSRVS